MVKLKFIVFLVFAAMTSQAATNWFMLKINAGGQVDPAATNVFRTNIIAGTGITITVGTNGELTINGGASGTNFSSLILTNQLIGTNYTYTLGTNKFNSILSWEWFTNLMTIFTNGLASQGYVNTAVGTTNAYVLTNNGVAYTPVIYSGTNTALASNQVASTIKGVTGQTNNLLEWGTNNSSGNMIRQGYINSAGAITPTANNTLDLGTTAFNWDNLYINKIKVPSYVWFSTAGGYIYYPNDVNGVRFRNASSDAYTAGIGSNGVWTTQSIGIGTTAPAAKLDVVGTANIGSLLIATQSISTLRSNLLAPTAITFPNSTVNWTNPLNCNIELYIDNTAVTGTAIKKNGTQIFGGLSNDVIIHLQPGEYFSETYSVGTPVGTYSPF